MGEVRIKTDPRCPQCGKAEGRVRVPDNHLGRQVVRLFGKDANRSNVTLCLWCEKPARQRASTCSVCGEAFVYYGATRARRRDHCSDECWSRRNADYQSRHRIKVGIRRERDRWLDEWVRKSMELPEPDPSEPPPTPEEEAAALRMIEEFVAASKASGEWRPTEPTPEEIAAAVAAAYADDE
jgi:hypothetical protein